MGNKNKVLDEAIKTSQTLKKTYSYEKQGIKLDFTLNTKNKEELKIFVEIMAKATEDIEKDIEIINGQEIVGAQFKKK